MSTLGDFFESVNFEFLNIEYKLEEKYSKIWEAAYLPSQQKKIIENNINEQIKRKAFNGLSKRGKFLCQLYDYFECENIAEVGTAEGYQFFTFCDHIRRNNRNSKVYTCDIRDVREKSLSKEYEDIGNFINGTSKEMSEKIVSDEEKIDFFWIDGAHHNSAVLTDVIRLAKTQSKNCIWVFDDYNERFGIFNELNFISNFNENRTITLGPTASGKPNNMLILRGVL